MARVDRPVGSVPLVIASAAGSVAFLVSTAVVMAGGAALMWRAAKQREPVDQVDLTTPRTEEGP